MKQVTVTESLAGELEGMKHEFQDKLAYLLNYASAMGDYGNSHGELAVLHPVNRGVMLSESRIRLLGEVSGCEIEKED